MIPVPATPIGIRRVRPPCDVGRRGRAIRAGWIAWGAVLYVLVTPLAVTAQQAGVIYEVQSKYQRISVRDTDYGYRQLIFDGHPDGFDAIQSEMDLANPDVPTLSYARHMMAALAVVERPRRILVVGLGGACIQRYVHRLLPEAVIETAELDPEVRAVAAAYFFFKEDARQVVHLGDGRAFVETTKQRYDLIILDAFSATSIPDRLTTREFLQAVKDRLAEGGVVCANLWSSEASYWDMVKTYAAVFPEFHVLKCAGSANNLVLAMPVRTGLTVRGWVDRATAFEKIHPTGLDLPRLIDYGAEDTTTIPDSARILLDPQRGRDSFLLGVHSADGSVIESAQ